MSKISKFIATLLLGAALFVLIMSVVGWNKVLESFFLLLSFKGLAILGITIVEIWVSVVKWRFIIRKITGRSKFKDLGKIWLTGFALTFMLTPAAALGGEPFRAYFAKKYYNLDWRKSAGSVIIERIFDWTIFLILTFAGISVFLFYSRVLSDELLYFFIPVLLILSGALLFFYFKMIKKEGFLRGFLKIAGIDERKLANSQNGNHIGETIFGIEEDLIDFFSIRKKKFWQGMFLALIKYFLLYVRVGAVLYFLTGRINPLEAFAVFGITNIALVFPLPAALGSLEATGILAFTGVGITASTGTIFALMLRNADILVAILGVIFLIKITIKVTGSKITELIGKMNNNKS